MKPSARRIERLLAKVEAELACRARPRRYVFHDDEIAEAEAQPKVVRSGRARVTALSFSRLVVYPRSKIVAGRS